MTRKAEKTPAAPRLEVDVRRNVINAAERRRSSTCMVSNAVKECWPDAKRISTDIQTIRLTMDGVRCVYLTPRKVQSAIVKFDRGVHTAPFRFQLRNGQATTPRRTGKSSKAVLRYDQGGGAGSVPSKRGGRTPPLASPRAGIRSFGLRNLEF